MFCCQIVADIGWEAMDPYANTYPWQVDDRFRCKLWGRQYRYTLRNDVTHDKLMQDPLSMRSGVGHVHTYPAHTTGLCPLGPMHFTASGRTSAKISLRKVTGALTENFQTEITAFCTPVGINPPNFPPDRRPPTLPPTVPSRIGHHFLSTPICQEGLFHQDGCFGG